MSTKNTDYQLLVVDIQERLVPHIERHQHLLMRAKQLVRGAALLGVPITFVEQYPAGLGATHPEVLNAAGSATVHAKDSFSAMAANHIQQHLLASDRNKLVICGMEAHVCVLQTALDALRAGFQVCLAWDACGSRFTEDKQLAQARLEAAGCEISSAEMLLFEWMGERHHPAFKSIIALLKSAGNGNES